MTLPETLNEPPIVGLWALADEVTWHLYDAVVADAAESCFAFCPAWIHGPDNQCGPTVYMATSAGNVMFLEDCRNRLWLMCSDTKDGSGDAFPVTGAVRHERLYEMCLSVLISGSDVGGAGTRH
jgi:hypothetical protein